MGDIWNGTLIVFGLLLVILIFLFFPIAIWDLTDLRETYLLIFPLLLVVAFGFWELKK